MKRKHIVYSMRTSTLSRSPKTMAAAPVVKMPPLNNTFGPILFKYCPYSGDTMNTINSNIPNTSPYSVALHPFLSAWTNECEKETMNLMKCLRMEFVQPTKCASYKNRTEENGFNAICFFPQLILIEKFSEIRSQRILHFFWFLCSRLVFTNFINENEWIIKYIFFNLRQFW